MDTSYAMKLKLDKIDNLVKKGYSIRTKETNLIPILISPEGKFVNVFLKSKIGDDSLPRFSWIAFFFTFVFATQIKDWKYFKIFGFIIFIFSFFESIFKIDFTLVTAIGIPILYGYGYPFQKWLFLKSNKEEFGIFTSILLGLFLSFVVAIPGFIVSGFFKGFSYIPLE